MHTDYAPESPGESPVSGEMRGWGVCEGRGVREGTGDGVRGGD